MRCTLLHTLKYASLATISHCSRVREIPAKRSEAMEDLAKVKVHRSRGVAGMVRAGNAVQHTHNLMSMG